MFQLYFTFSDFTIPTTQAAFTGPAMSYARYAKDKQSMAIMAESVVRSTDNQLSAAVLDLQNSKNHTTTCCPTVHDDVVATTKRIDENSILKNSRQMRLYQTMFKIQRPTNYVYSSSRLPEYQKKAMDGELKYHTDSVYEFDRRSDFPQLATYQTPFSPKSIVDVMKYVTTIGSPPKKADAAVEEYMVAQETKTRYVPIQVAEEINRLLPETVIPTSDSTMRFRNQFGQPNTHSLKIPIVSYPDDFMKPPDHDTSYPDDFMKPPDPDASYSMNFKENAVSAVHLTVKNKSTNFPSNTEVVFRHPPKTNIVFSPSSINNNYPVFNVTRPETNLKNRHKKKNQKPISVMLNIFPLSDNENEDDQDQSNYYKNLFQCLIWMFFCDLFLLDFDTNLTEKLFNCILLIIINRYRQKNNL